MRKGQKKAKARAKAHALAQAKDSLVRDLNLFRDMYGDDIEIPDTLPERLDSCTALREVLALREEVIEEFFSALEKAPAEVG